jgi:hypothetical protein
MLDGPGQLRNSLEQYLIFARYAGRELEEVKLLGSFGDIRRLLQPKCPVDERFLGALGGRCRFSVAAPESV